LARAEARGLALSSEQVDALAHATDGRDLGSWSAMRNGKERDAGRGKRGMGSGGLRGRGVALSGIAAENLKSGSGIASRTIASLEHGWEQGRDLLTSRDVLSSTRRAWSVRVSWSGCYPCGRSRRQVVLVGDIRQLQAIEAGAAFRSIHERHGGAEIGEVRRQCEDWQRNATRDLATGRTGHALAAYRSQGMVHEAKPASRRAAI